MSRQNNGTHIRLIFLHKIHDTCLSCNERIYHNNSSIQIKETTYNTNLSKPGCFPQEANEYGKLLSKHVHQIPSFKVEGKRLNSPSHKHTRVHTRLLNSPVGNTVSFFLSWNFSLHKHIYILFHVLN